MPCSPSSAGLYPSAFAGSRGTSVDRRGAGSAAEGRALGLSCDKMHS